MSKSVANCDGIAQDTGGPAFPVVMGVNSWASGMTLLDWFAGQYMAANGYAMQQDHGLEADEVAQDCYLVAAAMLAEKRRREG